MKAIHTVKVRETERVGDERRKNHKRRSKFKRTCEKEVAKGTSTTKYV